MANLNRDISAKINSFIKENAYKYNNTQELTDNIFLKFKVKLSLNNVRARCNLERVSTKNITVSSKLFDFETDASDTAKSLLTLLKRKKRVWTVEDMANALNVSPKKTREAILELKAVGHTVEIDEGVVELQSQLPSKGEPVKIDRKLLDGNKFRFLLTGDNHIANKHFRQDVLEALYDIAESEGITTAYQVGNMIDGDHHFNKHEVSARGLDAQTRALVDVWPKKKRITTHFITGDDHEGWYINREGIDVGFYIQQKFEEAGRTDFQYVGHVEADILLPGKKRRSIMRLIHAGGGSAYATSYSTQKIVESYQGGEKPRILCVGHYHKCNFDYSREVYTFQAGCTCDQTTFMRKKKLAAHVGGWIIEATVNDEGDVIRCQGEWIPFYDKGTYNKAWKAKNF